MTTSAPHVPDRRLNIVGVAHFAVKYGRYFSYSEDGAVRMNYLTTNAKPHQIDPIITTDCSGFVRLCYFWGGAPDPMGTEYKVPEGYTGTIVERGVEISRSETRGGDVVVFGPGTGEHTALVIEGGTNPMTVSFGENPPSFCTVEEDGRLPQRYYRFETRLRADFTV